MGLPYTPRQAALWFAGQGHKILPLHSITDAGACTCGSAECHSPGKHPHAELVPNGAKNASIDVAVIEAWFDERYWLNYGIACDQLFVVDVDVKDYGLETWRVICGEPTRYVPHTRTVRTGGGGLHVFFQPIGANIRNGKLDRGIDLRTRGAYVVGAGCRHKSGNLYVWDHQCSPAEAPLAEAPAWLVSLVETRTHAGNVIPMSEWRRIARRPVCEGERHTTALKLIGHLVAIGADEEVVRELLLGWNHGRCEPPLPDGDIIGMVARIVERERAKHNWLAVPIDAEGGL